MCLGMFEGVFGCLECVFCGCEVTFFAENVVESRKKCNFAAVLGVAGSVCGLLMLKDISKFFINIANLTNSGAPLRDAAAASFFFRRMVANFGDGAKFKMKSKFDDEVKIRE